MNKKSLGAILVIVLVAVGAYLLVADNASEGADNEVATGENIVMMSVGPEKEECTGVAPRECLVVNGELFYAPIDGFEFEPGFAYELRVEKTERENVPADASSFNYELVEVVEKTPADSDGETASTSEEVSELTDSSWQWQETTYSDGETVAAESDDFVLTFTDERFSATTDCNNVMGSYSASAGEVNFSQMASTKKACVGDSQEGEFTEMLSEVQGYTFTDEGELALTLKFDSGSMIFTSTDAPAGN